MRSYIFEIDLDKDGAFSNPDGIVSASLLSITWGLGMPNSLNQIARPMSATLVFSDPDLLFSRDKGTAPFGRILRGLMGRLQVVVNDNTYTLMTGWIMSVSTHDRANGTISTLVIEDKMLFLQDAEYVPTVSTDIRIDEEIQNIFDSGIIGYPYESTYWILGGSTLGVDTRLFQDMGFVDAEESKTTLDFAGDAADRGNGVSALGYIMDLVQAEMGGRFFVDRYGQFTFHNRHHDVRAETVDTFTNGDYTDSQAAEDALYNDIVVNYYPRDVGTVGTVLFQSDNVPITISGGTTRTITGRYRDVDNEDATVGGKDVITPVANTDISANSASDGSGDDVLAQLNVSYELGGTSTKFVIDNPTGSTIYITKLQVRGTPLISHQQQEAKKNSASSVYQYGYSPMMPIDARFISDADLADGFANQMLARFESPLIIYDSIAFELGQSDELDERILKRCIGDRIQVTNSVSGHDLDYVIVGEGHSISGRRHSVRWQLRPASRVKAWILGESVLGVDTLLTL